MDKLVSVIMPAYNLEKYILESIQSVQRQTYSNWELIIVNDGSTDKTAEKVKSVAEADGRIMIISQTNAGAAAARNAGLNAAAGHYIAFLDGDDLWDENFLKELMSVKETSQADMVYCGYTHLYGGGVRRKFSYGYVSGSILLDVVCGKTQIHIGCILVEKALIDKIGIRFAEGCPIGEDQEFIIKLVSIATVQAIHRELMLYRIRIGSSINSSWNWKKHIHAILSLKRAKEFVISMLQETQHYDQVVHAFEQRIAYKLFKFLWRMIKQGNHSEAIELMETPEFESDLAALNIEDLKTLDRMKYRITQSRNCMLWNVVARLRFI